MTTLEVIAEVRRYSPGRIVQQTLSLPRAYCCAEHPGVAAQDIHTIQPHRARRRISWERTRLIGTRVPSRMSTSNQLSSPRDQTLDVVEVDEMPPVHAQERRIRQSCPQIG